MKEQLTPSYGCQKETLREFWFTVSLVETIKKLSKYLESIVRK